MVEKHTQKFEFKAGTQIEGWLGMCQEGANKPPLWYIEN